MGLFERKYYTAAEVKEMMQVSHEGGYAKGLLEGRIETQEMVAKTVDLANQRIYEANQNAAELFAENADLREDLALMEGRFGFVDDLFPSENDPTPVGATDQTETKAYGVYCGCVGDEQYCGCQPDVEVEQDTPLGPPEHWGYSDRELVYKLGVDIFAAVEDLAVAVQTDLEELLKLIEGGAEGIASDFDTLAQRMLKIEKTADLAHNLAALTSGDLEQVERKLVDLSETTSRIKATALKRPATAKA